MIPKKIHYCWFGRNPLPEDAKKCIASWRKFFPDYEIIEWNEDNFDVNQIPYTAQAYEAKKYAFVSDYARFKILYDNGGIYFDTDVEVIKSFEDILQEGPFMGFEKNIDTETVDRFPGINPGLGIGSYAGMNIYGKLLEVYDDLNFDINDTIVTHTTTLFIERGLKEENVKQTIDDVTIYPTDFFCPMNAATGQIKITGNTVSIHHYNASWMDHNSLSYKLHLLKNILIKTFGSGIILKISYLIKKIKDRK